MMSRNAVRRTLVLVLFLSFFIVGTWPAVTGFILPGAESALALTKDVPFVPTPEYIVEEMLTMAKVGKDDTVIDLGSGDGRIVIAAAKRGAHATGIDIDPERIRESNANAKEAGVEDRVKFIQGNIFEADISPATVLTMYLLPSVNMKLRPKILSDLKPGTRVVSHSFDMENWKPDASSGSVYMWIIPANVSGKWQFEKAESGQVTALDLRQEFQNVNGTMVVAGKQMPIRNARIQGDTLKFSAGPDGSARQYSFRTQGDTLKGGAASAVADGAAEGEVMTAHRVEGTKKPLDKGKM